MYPELLHYDIKSTKCQAIRDGTFYTMNKTLNTGKLPTLRKERKQDRIGNNSLFFLLHFYIPPLSQLREHINLFTLQNTSITAMLKNMKKHPDTLAISNGNKPNGKDIRFHASVFQPICIRQLGKTQPRQKGYSTTTCCRLLCHHLLLTQSRQDGQTMAMIQSKKTWIQKA